MAESKVQVGDVAPDVELINGEGEKVRLYDLFSKHSCNVLFFYPGNFTPVCTKQCNLIARPDNWEAISKYDCGVFGVSTDDAESHKKFMAKYNTLSDKDGAANAAYKVGKDFMLMKGRTTFLIDGDNKVAMRYNSALQYGNHIKKTLETLEELHKEGRIRTKSNAAEEPPAAAAEKPEAEAVQEKQE